jgi:hypothetical protein
MRWAITDITNVVYDPTTWNSDTFSRILGTRGISVSLPQEEPASDQLFDGAAIRQVTEVPATISSTQKAVGETFAFADGIVTATAIVVDKSAEEIAAEAAAAIVDYMSMIRVERDKRIAAIYWRVERNYTQVAGSVTPSDDSTKMTEIYVYLQDLRDMPNDNPDIDTNEEYVALVWPTVPA